MRCRGCRRFPILVVRTRVSLATCGRGRVGGFVHSKWLDRIREVKGVRFAGVKVKWRTDRMLCELKEGGATHSKSMGLQRAVPSISNWEKCCGHCSFPVGRLQMYFWCFPWEMLSSPSSAYSNVLTVQGWNLIQESTTDQPSELRRQQSAAGYAHLTYRKCRTVQRRDYLSRMP
jgi:hypothetical protein